MRYKGFTLLELMIVIVVIAILAAIAYPSYLEQVRKTGRKEVIGIMLDAAGRMERIRSQVFKYRAITAPTDDRYGIVVDVSDDGKTYTITATPSGDQANDSCGEIELNNQGTWLFTHSGDVVPQNQCM